MEPCDRCAQRAYVQLWHPKTHQRMTYCAHHYREVETPMRLRMWLVEDDRRAELLAPA